MSWLQRHRRRKLIQISWLAQAGFPQAGWQCHRDPVSLSVRTPGSSEKVSLATVLWLPRLTNNPALPLLPQALSFTYRPFWLWPLEVTKPNGWEGWEIIHQTSSSPKVSRASYFWFGCLCWTPLTHPQWNAGEGSPGMGCSGKIAVTAVEVSLPCLMMNE